MIIDILKNYRRNLLEVIFLSIGYIIGILSLSIGISVIKESIEYNLDSTSGYVKNITLANIDFTENNLELKKNINSIINNITNIGEVQIINLDSLEINNDLKLKSTVVLTMFKEKSNWHIPIIEGDFFNESNFKNNEKVVIIGKNLADKLFPNGIDDNSKVEILNEKYKVIGISGRENRATQWDDVIYIPYNTCSELLNINGQDRNSITLVLRTKSTDREYVQSKVTTILDDQLKNTSCSYNIDFDYLENRNNSNIFNSIFGTLFIAGTILVIVVINVINLSRFWILNRRKEICIKKLLGELDSNIIYSIIVESIIIATFSMCIALFIQYIIPIIFKNMLSNIGFNCIPSIFNVLGSFLVACICGIISSIVPIKEMMNMQPIEALRNA
ncbi:ABC transporter permease [Clostridium weizhouense]|uniref:ABC transporter permease n=1 Tax=Clostridium weizhouense TaxID=2859781 RepID=A0ABS7ASW8_9CLOT|nr:ABC transporter permease [Clostridium weizhouense]MBW6411506.1 ABC transporter permease [Clostridium weizhouense]